MGWCMTVLKYIFTLILLCFFPTMLSAQHICTWTSITSLNQATGITSDQQNNIIWVGTTGGLLSYKPETKILDQWRNTDGLEQNHITALLHDSLRQGVWIGSENGVISFYSQQTSSFRHLYTLLTIDELEHKRIHQFTLKGDSLFAATAFGLALIDAEKWEIRDLMLRVGTLPEEAPIQDLVIHQNKLLVISSDGLAIGDLNAKNLLAPQSWQQINIGDAVGLNTITLFNRHFIVGADNGLYQLEGDALEQRLEFPAQQVVDFCPSNETLAILTPDSLLLADTLFQIQVLADTLKQARQICKGHIDEAVWIASSNPPLLGFAAGDITPVFPNCPDFNTIAVIGKDHLGRIWTSSSATDDEAKGIGFLQQGEWQNFAQTLPGLDSVNVSQFSDMVALNKQTCFGTWGNGLLRLENGMFSRFNSENSTLVGSLSNPEEVIISSVARDKEGRVWLTNYQTQDGPLQVMLAEGVFQAFGSDGPVSSRFPSDLAALQVIIDEIGRQWMITSASDGTRGKGLVVFEDNETPDNPADDSWLRVTVGSSEGKLPDNTVHDIIQDQDGSIWLATQKGLAYFFDAYSVTASRVEPVIRSPFLQNEAIFSMAVDGINRKWAGTRNGLWLFNADASEVLAHYTKENSPLLSNNILDVFADYQTGNIYVGTDKGMSVLKTDAVSEQSRLGQTLKLYPNPFKPDGSSYLTIDGLGQQASVKILSISGKQVRQIPGSGGRLLTWDGRSEGGQMVSSGIYLVVAVSKDGKNIALGKLAVLKK